MDISGDLYDLALTLLGACIITIALTVIYIVGIIRFVKKQRVYIKDIEKIESDNINHKENN
jgi:hypothetical protein